MATFVDGAFSIDFDSFEVTMNGDPVQLPKRECLFLVALVRSEGHVVSREALVQQILGTGFTPKVTDRAVLKIRHILGWNASGPLEKVAGGYVYRAGVGGDP